MSGTLMGEYQLFIVVIGKSWEEIYNCYLNCELFQGEDIKDISSHYVLNLNYPQFLPSDIFFESCSEEQKREDKRD
jgi:hypothetical protein